mmetsp:Transcript_10278/g.18162  ORF Transcript_10278/g.18162 Transcript_10278/m.18162 type:complete len:212 (+) Transcript_10278:487-1122(+)
MRFNRSQQSLNQVLPLLKHRLFPRRPQKVVLLSLVLLLWTLLLSPRSTRPELPNSRLLLRRLYAKLRLLRSMLPVQLLLLLKRRPMLWLPLRQPRKPKGLHGKPTRRSIENQGKGLAELQWTRQQTPKSLHTKKLRVSSTTLAVRLLGSRGVTCSLLSVHEKLIYYLMWYIIILCVSGSDKPSLLNCAGQQANVVCHLRYNLVQHESFSFT